MIENNKTYKSIGEVAKILNLVDRKSGKLSTHTLRFWEKEFKEIKPIIFSGKRRYYDDKSIKILKKIHFLLKKRGMTIKGAKNYLKTNNSKLDVIDNQTINKQIFKVKLNKISKLLKDIRSNGKKNTR
ncbi:MerR family transcriptional regulator [Candidatus Pelagibacter sp.]|nr:MerR family transcriptional regulator [Candidatus Pelagibacter sp.]